MSLKTSRSLISKHPHCRILGDCNLVTCLAVVLALLEFVVELEDGLAISFDVRVQVSTAMSLHMQMHSQDDES